jgi:hypothetical protein
MTRDGQHIADALMRFMLFYAGVFALIALTASVGVGVAATDRAIMSAGGRIAAQAAHRAASFAAVGSWRSTSPWRCSPGGPAPPTR